MKSKAFIFDLDGVIVDTARYHFLAWQKLAQTLGIPFTHEQNEQLKGVSRVRSLEKILAWGGLELSETEFNALMAQKNEDYLAYIDAMTAEEILPEVPRVLEFLRQRNQRITLGSASKNARAILEKVSLLDYFEVIVDGNSVSKAKPDPEVFLKAADGVGVAYSDSIVFEDSLAGIQAANTAGMYSIGIGDPTVLDQAQVVYADFTQLTDSKLETLIDM